MKGVALVAGNGNLDFAKKVAKRLKSRLIKVDARKFSDTETYVRILESVRGKDVFIIQSLSEPVNDNLVELLLLIDAAKRSSAKRINVVIPYLAYTRQDRTNKPGEPVSAKVVAQMLEATKADRIITMDLHSPQILGFFGIPVEHLFSFDLFAHYLKKIKLKNICVVSPDEGAFKKAKDLAEILNTDTALILKHRPKQEQVKALKVIGDVKGKNCIIIDDIINTGGTIESAINELKKRKAKDVFVLATHGIFAKDGLKTILNAKPKEVIVLDTINQKEKNAKNFKVLTASNLFAEAIKRVSQGKRLSSMYKRWVL